MIIRLFEDNAIKLKQIEDNLFKMEIKLEITYSNIVRVETYSRDQLINKYFLYLSNDLKKELKMCENKSEFHNFVDKYNLKEYRYESELEFMNRDNTTLYIDEDKNLYIYFGFVSMENIYVYSFEYIYSQINRPYLNIRYSNGLRDLYNFGFVDYNNSSCFPKAEFENKKNELKEVNLDQLNDMVNAEHELRLKNRNRNRIKLYLDKSNNNLSILHPFRGYFYCLDLTNCTNEDYDYLLNNIKMISKHRAKEYNLHEFKPFTDDLNNFLYKEIKPKELKQLISTLNNNDKDNNNIDED